jgi:hypothetical protein
MFLSSHHSGEESGMLESLHVNPQFFLSPLNRIFHNRYFRQHKALDGSADPIRQSFVNQADTFRLRRRCICSR